MSLSTCPAPARRGEEWIRAARDGSLEALGRLLDNFRPYLLRLANAELDARLQAKLSGSDLVQKTFLEAQHLFERFHGNLAGDLGRTPDTARMLW